MALEARILPPKRISQSVGGTGIWSQVSQVPLPRLRFTTTSWLHSVFIYFELDYVSLGLESELFFSLINLIADIKEKTPDVIEQENVYNPLWATELLATKFMTPRKGEIIKRRGRPRQLYLQKCHVNIYGLTSGHWHTQLGNFLETI